MFNSLLLLVEKNVTRSSSKNRLLSTTNNSFNLSMTINKVLIWQKEYVFLKLWTERWKFFFLFQNQPHRDVTWNTCFHILEILREITYHFSRIFKKITHASLLLYKSKHLHSYWWRIFSNFKEHLFKGTSFSSCFCNFF